jgi:Fe-S cluster biosynthesis and repair protein YggX
MGGPLGTTILATVCAECWGEWTQAEVMVINELRLNFMDPAAQQVLERHMREFLLLDET